MSSFIENLKVPFDVSLCQDAKEANKEEDAPPEPEREYTEADIPILQEEVTELQRQFDASVVEKHSLEIELSASNERLWAATNMIVR